MSTALYIHIPFCRKKCFYCDFYSVPYKRDLAKDYIAVLCQQIKEINAEISTIFMGGGTPTVIDINLWKQLLESLRKFSRQAQEFTIEVNPESLYSDKLKLFLDKGVSRLSIGVQSFSDEKLKFLGRIHSGILAKERINLAKKLGFNNLNLDLIFGVPGETLEDWKNDLSQAVKLPIKHISTYSLTYEKHTPLFEGLKKKLFEPSDDHLTAEMYKLAMEFLAKKGFLQYEVSNFARRGFACQHNLNYWDNQPYIGLGPSAVSFVDGFRKMNLISGKEYIQRVKQGKGYIVNSENLSQLARAKESAAIKIRTSSGINFKNFERRWGYDFIEIENQALKELLKSKLVEYIRRDNKKIGVRLTQKGFLFADNVSSEFL